MKTKTAKCAACNTEFEHKVRSGSDATLLVFCDACITRMEADIFVEQECLLEQTW